ncbi:Restriction endonuclease S subunit [Gulbenkiania indica]|uniref:Restriction endonuclease S subunit n=1 Tax=Gulbenkiania indica TaxID=375574 RepID=A0A0K6GUZ0_9NEIS|nr:restriction endonuclease subunit S [Gulbenkiania indica]CUA82413.1 Restriction endonuclease S subunit [Gulbenkiania indica]
MDLQNIKLKELPLAIIDGDRSSKYPKREEFQSEGVVFLNSTNIFDGRLDLSDANYITEEKYLSIKKGRVEPGDIVMTTRGSIGKVARIPKGFRGLINAQMLLIRADEKMFSGAFLFHWLRSEIGQTKLRNFSSGAAQPQIPIRDLQEIEVPIPSLIAQHRIASILSAYDDLIENNTRRIAILEEMARRIYEEWFVRFRFPGHEQVKMVESELGLIPEGWRLRAFDEVASFVNGYAFKPDDWGTSGLPIIKIKELKSGIQSDTPRYSNSLQEKYHVRNGALLFSWSADLDVYIWAGGEGWLNQHLFIVKALHDSIPASWLFHALKASMPNFRSRSNGATMKHIKRSALSEVKVLLSTESLMNEFSITVQPMHDLVISLTQKNRNLRATRDLLLPKLISGELDVSTLPEPEEAIAA